MITAIHGEINRPVQNHLDEQLCTSLTVSLSFCHCDLMTEKHKHKETTCQLTPCFQSAITAVINDGYVSIFCFIVALGSLIMLHVLLT